MAITIPRTMTIVFKVNHIAGATALMAFPTMKPTGIIQNGFARTGFITRFTMANSPPHKSQFLA